MLETHPLVESLGEHPLQEAIQVGGVVEMQRDSVTLAEERLEHRYGVRCPPSSPQAIQEDRAV